jgi:hypothetical protein
MAEFIRRGDIAIETDSGNLPPVNLPTVPGMQQAPQQQEGERAPVQPIEIEVTRPANIAAEYQDRRQQARSEVYLEGNMGPHWPAIFAPPNAFTDFAEQTAVGVVNSIEAGLQGLTIEGPLQAAVGATRLLEQGGILKGISDKIDALLQQKMAAATAGGMPSDGVGGIVRDVAREGGAAATVAVPAVMLAPKATLAGVLAWLGGWTVGGAGQNPDAENLFDMLAEVGDDDTLWAAVRDAAIKPVAKKPGDAKDAKVQKNAAVNALFGPPFDAVIKGLTKMPGSTIRQMKRIGDRGRVRYETMAANPEAMVAPGADEVLQVSQIEQALGATAELAEKIQRELPKDVKGAAPVAVGTGGAAAVMSDEPDAGEVELQPGQQGAGLGDKFLRLSLKMKSEPSRAATKAATGDIVKMGKIEAASETLAGHMQFGEITINTGKIKGMDFNFTRLGVGDDMQSFINEVSTVMKDEIDRAKRGKITHEQTRIDAALLGADPEATLRLSSLKAEEMHAARVTLATVLTKTKEQMKIAYETGSPEELLKLRQMEQLFVATQLHVKGLQTETARTLSAMRLTAEAMKDARNFQDLLDTFGGYAANVRMAKMLDAIDDPEKMAQAVAKTAKATRWDMFMEYYYFALLSAPTTHVVNFMSSLGTVLWGVPEHFTAATIGSVRRAMGGEGGVYMAEVGSQWAGLVDGVVKGSHAALDVLKTGEAGAIGKLDAGGAPQRRAITAEAMRNLPEIRATGNIGGLMNDGRWLASGIDFMGEYVIRGPKRLMMTADEFNKGVAYNMELRRRAIRQALDEGKSGADVDARAAQILQSPDDFPDVKIGALDFASYATFTSPMGGAGQAISGILNEVPALRLVVPFLKTPANVLGYALERTPLAPLSRDVRENLIGRHGAAAQDMAIARLGLGTAMGAGFLSMAGAGMITGGGPKDPIMKKKLEGTGWQPYSIYNPVTNSYVSYRRLDPLAMTMGMAADMVDVWSYATEDEQNLLATSLALTVYRNLIDKSYMQGVSNVGKALTDMQQGRAGAVESFLGNLAGSVAVPAGVAWIGRTVIEGEDVRRAMKSDKLDEAGFAVNPALQFMQEAVNVIKARAPGLGEGLPPQTNFWGEEQIIRPGVGFNMIPVVTSALKHDPKKLEAIGLPAAPNRWAQLNHPGDMTDGQFRDFLKIVGIDGEMVRIGSAVGAHPDRLGGVAMTEQQKYDYVQLVNQMVIPMSGPDRGLTLKAALENLVQSDEYIRASDFPEVSNSKIALLRKKVGYYRHDANEDPRSGLGGADRLLTELYPGMLQLVFERRSFVKPDGR